jgi:tetratricopeptide (TPR) repeat protein
MKRNSFLLSLVLAASLISVSPSVATAQTASQNASARALWVDGRTFFDDGKYADAEKKFREALNKYPKSDQADRTSYYLISTLVKLGNVSAARKEIETFRKNYPQSSWKQDVDGKSIELGGGISSVLHGEPPVNYVNAERALREIQASRELEAAQQRLGNFRSFSAPAPIPVNASVQTEVLRQILEKDIERGIENAKEMLKADASDNAVIYNLPSIANSASSQAFPLLIGIVSNPASNPNARSTAMYWMSRRMSDKPDEKDALSKALMDLLSKKDADASLVTDAFVRMNTSERRLTFEQMASSTRADKVDLFEKIYRGVGMNTSTRNDVVQAVAKLTDAKATAFLVDVAQTDKDTSVRRTAVQSLAGRKDVDVKTLEAILKSLPKATPINTITLGQSPVNNPPRPVVPVPVNPTTAPPPAPVRQ